MRRDSPVHELSRGARPRLILMFGPSVDFPGGMTEVIRAYCAAGVFELWPLRYLPTFAEQNLSAKLWPWLCAVLGSVCWVASRMR